MPLCGTIEDYYARPCACVTHDVKVCEARNQKTGFINMFWIHFHSIPIQASQFQRTH